MKVETIQLADIKADPAAQPRTAINVDRVTEYTEDMDRGAAFPPLVLFHDGLEYWLADGFHRFYAAVNAGKKAFQCEVHFGGLRDAVLYSCGANAAHGMRRTNEDKRRAVAKLLDDKEWSGWADNDIAKRCNVGWDLVKAMRKEMHTSGSGSMRKFIHPRTGTVATMDTSAIGKRPDSPLIAKALREIERYVDMMPAPSAAVDHFPADQRYLFPLSKIESMAAWLTAFAAAWRAEIEARAYEHT